VENLYQDMLELISHLFSLVKGISYDLKETAEVHQRYASFFWESVCGERTEGHPRYRPPDGVQRMHNVIP
jgi:hypothetical protein